MENIDEELEDKEFELLLKEKRHKELIELLKKILIKIESDTISKSIEKSISLLVEKANNKELPSSVVSIGKAILKKLDDLTSKKEWVFSIDRNSFGYISSVTAKQT